MIRGNTSASPASGAVPEMPDEVGVGDADGGLENHQQHARRGQPQQRGHNRGLSRRSARAEAAEDAATGCVLIEVESRMASLY